MYFNNLLNYDCKKFDKEFHSYVLSSLSTIEKNALGSNCGLNCHFSEEEISLAIKKLKNGKATGPPDSVGNEFLKSFNMLLTKPLSHLYNSILSNSCHPNDWSISHITPIFKSGDKNDLNNYRGIAVNSCVCKLFTSILTDRLDKHMTKNKFWKTNQAGFKKGHRTEDNMFVINTIFQSYVVKKKQKVFCAFVDFKKFFDRINRDFLLYKLLKYNVTGEFYNIIKSMYSNTNYRVKLHEGLSKIFCGNIGVKQGCNLSPCLSNIFQNDLHDIFDDSCCPVSIGDIKLSSLSWADDLVLTSLSEAGLQQCLNKLNEYCYKWGLEVNISKTKCMVMSNNKRNCSQSKVFYNNSQLENVDSYKYLGIILQYNGKYNMSIKSIMTKCSRASYLIRSAMNAGGTYSISLANELFDKQILPILNYGCSIWSMPRNTSMLYLDNIGDINTCTKTYVTSLIKAICPDKTIPVEMAKRLGKTDSLNRPVLVKFRKLLDKEVFMRALARNSTYNYIKCRNADQSYSNYEIEKVHTKFCKQTLNLRKNCSNLAVLAELGRYPVIYKNWALSIKYWLRLEKGSENLILNSAYKLAKSEQHEFCQSIQALLSQHGFGYVWHNPTLTSKTFHVTFRNRLQDEFEQNWNSASKESSLTSLLQSLKSDYTLSDYLLVVRDVQIRNILTKLRVSAHCLNICTGRYLGIIRMDRKCHLCKSNEVEDASHFILRCEYFKKERDHFLSQLQMIQKNFISLSEINKLRLILNLSSQNKDSVNIICAYLKDIYTKRQDLKCNLANN